MEPRERRLSFWQIVGGVLLVLALLFLRVWSLQNYRSPADWR